MNKHDTRRQLLAQLTPLLFAVIVIVITLNATGHFVTDNPVISVDSERQRIEKFAVQCYASEGSYPPDLAYLEQHYGLILKHEQYAYFYDVFASNVMPTIQVTPQLADQNIFEPPAGEQ